MDLGTGQRTYVLGVSGSVTARTHNIINVPFTDTAGNLIKCNYCSIRMMSGQDFTHQAGAILELSGLSRTGDMTTDDIPVFHDDGSITNPSGVLGIGVITGRYHDDTAEWHGSNGEVATGAKIKLITEHDVFHIMLTYGNLYPLNNLRLEQSYDRGV
jgi:hypothetical protein